MKRFVYIVLLTFVVPLAVCGQEYGYTQYNSRDGLAGGTIYCMVQDKDGFIWLGTEGGLSRFDGTHFKSFTREDGLPDNEVVQLFADSKGRIWIAPFKKTVCYYYKGKIHTAENDPMLKRIPVVDYIIHFAEDEAGNMLLQEYNKMYLVSAQGQVQVVDSVNGKPFIQIANICAHPGGGFIVIDQGRAYDFVNGHFSLKKEVNVYSGGHFSYFAFNSRVLVWRRDRFVTEAGYFNRPGSVTFPLAETHINYNLLDDDHFGNCTHEGAIVYDISGKDSVRHFLPGVPVNNMLKDTEGNIWFGTAGHGLYRLGSPYVLNLKLRNNNLPNQVFALAPYGETIMATTELNLLYKLNRKTGRLHNETVALQEKGFNPISKMIVYKDRFAVYGSNYSVYCTDLDFIRLKKQVYPLAFKDFCLSGDKLYVATKDNVFVIYPDTWIISDTVWHGRSTSVYADKDTAYIGTLDGLYRHLPNGTTQCLGDKAPALKTRITCIQKDSAGTVWVGTYGDGLIAVKNDRVIATLNRRNGLTSNVCRTFYLSGNCLWVGTDKGINKINVAQPGFPITKYTTGDGLVSDITNALYVDSNKVFVGSPEGITFFDEEKLISQSRCDLLFTDISVGGNTWSFDSIPALIDHNKNSIRFDYVGISYKSGGDVRYRYRLLGLDSTWRETRETFVSYPTLPSGDYQFQLQALNKFDIHSKMLTAGFTIDKMLYERTWFRLLLGLLFLAVTGIAVTLIIRRIRRREQEKTAISKRINELEQLSRKAQMNPHFIFNSLNSIQHYVLNSDLMGANKFISSFSRLIRQTLDFSSKPEISLEEELDYLTNYLELEKTRLEDSFAWQVHIDKTVNPADYYIPPMILQPFVENSVRHGLRFRRDKNGIVTISVHREGDYLICVLEDNGVGRKAAMQYKSISPINYQSKGLSLTADRIEMFNKEHEQKISMFIDDLVDDAQNALGTKVTLSFPVF
ncbi:two-component regulator propeller domain-containing protein [Niastella sp. OAS944]|uniref:sensor histidine kinase n=1 Tax=Niastella sp. OAS944 TaxID=2664089 RepID=UPI0034889D64|nr:ligand-binding sensor domain-containing protein [Chitinophagaceae bacterium OAS944]